jgi:hypothetical protein
MHILACAFDVVVMFHGAVAQQLQGARMPAHRWEGFVNYAEETG